MAPSSACSTSILCGAERNSGVLSAGCLRAVDSTAMTVQYCGYVIFRHGTHYSRLHICAHSHGAIITTLQGTGQQLSAVPVIQAGIGVGLVGKNPLDRNSSATR